ncbi:MAG: peptide chain release factor 2 [Clostridia bacterium]|nr:peptide chain release factor 2 [Clostridia bacterium]
MLILEQSKQTLDELSDKIDELGVSLDIENLKLKIEELESAVQSEGFWDDPQNSQKTLVELKIQKDKYESFINLKTLYNDTCELLQLASEDDDESMTEDILSDIKLIKKSYEDQRTQILLSGEYDRNNAIIAIHPGAGGTEAQDWAQMLYRMYSRWAEKRGFKVKVLDYLDGDEAGIKSVTFLVEGLYAYGYAKSESGVHRLVRVSPFDSSGRRHTSFASVEVAPEFNDEIKIEIKEEEIKVEAHRASGAGGQHVNKTDSAIRITHIPTGIVVGCQNERSQVQNREVALKMLKSKLLEIKEREHLEKIEDIKGIKNNIEWGSQIRSYVFMPYTLVKDNRTNYEVGDISSVMDGELDDFMNAFLKSKAQS